MIPLLLSIASSTLIFVIFKLFKRFDINTFQAIVINYFTAAILGFSLYGQEWNPSAMENSNWMLYAFISALLFISLFFVMGKSSQLNGVASTSVAVKMSMAVSLLFMIYLYGESITLLKITGILLAFIGVFMVSYQKGNQKANAAWMLLLLFIGSGILDFALNYVQKYELGVLSSSLFTAIGLGLAGCFGLIILLFKILQRKEKLQLKNVIAGIILGVPNYFSIYLLLLSYESTGWKDSTVLAITNVSVVLCSAIFGFIIFKENSTSRKIIGLVAAVLAIATLYIAN